VTKPKTGDQLHQGQVKKVVGTLGTETGLPTPLQNLLGGDPSPPPSNAPSGGGGGDVWPGVSCHTSGCGSGGGANSNCTKNEGKGCRRLQYGVKNSTPTVDFQVNIRVPDDYTASDTATLQIGGGQHQEGCGWDGYKLYVGINGKKNAMGIEYGDGPNYLEFKDAKIFQPSFSMQHGQTYKLRATKEVIGNTVRITMYVNNQMLGQVIDSGQLRQGTPFVKRMGCQDKPVDQLRIDNWTIQKDATPQYCLGVTSGPFNG